MIDTEPCEHRDDWGSTLDGRGLCMLCDRTVHIEAKPAKFNPLPLFVGFVLGSAFGAAFWALVPA